MGMMGTKCPSRRNIKMIDSGDDMEGEENE